MTDTAAGAAQDRPPIALRRTGHLAEVAINRPEARNALNLDMCLALREIFEALDADDEVRVVAVVSEGPVFCAGADLRERDGKTEGWVRRRRQAGFAAYAAIERCSRPVVAFAQGPVIGSGGEIAMACDFVVASRFASFRFPEPHWGTVGATQRLQRVIGKRRAKELLFTNRVMPAEEALTLGLVARLVEPDALDAARAEICETIARAYPLAMRLTKQAVDLGEEQAQDTGIRIEMAAIERCLADGGWRKGVDKFSAVVGSTKKGAPDGA